MKRRMILLGPVSLAGCASLLPAQKYTPRTDWPLNPPPPSVTSPNEAGKVLLLRDLNAGPGMNNLGLQTLQQDGSLVTAYYDNWAVDPADAATSALGVWLTASGAFSAVISPGSRLTADLIIEGEMTELVADLGANQARAVMTLVVIQSLNGNTRPLAQQQITRTAPLQGTNPAAQVAAERAALASALVQAVRLVTRFS